MQRVTTALDLAAAYRDHLRTLEQRYAPALATLDLDRLVIHSGTPKPRTVFDDQFWALRPTPHFQHWLPLAEAESALVIEPGKRPKLIWHRSNSIWERPPAPEWMEWEPSFDVITVGTPQDVKTHLPPAGPRTAFLGEDLPAARAWGFDLEQVGRVAPVLDQLRIRKTPYEIECLARANHRAILGHEALREAFEGGGQHSELELHLAFLQATSQDDPETPYKNIVAYGRNSAVLHHVSYAKAKAGAPDDGVLLVDAGATFHGYNSDITRTWVKGRTEAETRFAAMVQGLDQLQQRLCAEAAIGMPYEELHEASHRYAAGVLREIGVLRTSAAEALTRKLTRVFYPHGLGHALGLQTHDVGCGSTAPRPDNPFLRNTIEPGLYFIPGLLEPLRQGPDAGAVDWKLVDELSPLGGARIEDDVIVRSPGEGSVRNLTRESFG
jgi:Xaa-Pro dipeptidase